MANWRKNDDYVELRNAIRRKDKVKARSLILNNVRINNSRLKCNSPLHWAILQFEDLDIMKMLINKGANVHAKNHRNLKPLEVAIQNDKTEAAILLIRKGALGGEDLNALLRKVIEKNNHIIAKNVIDYGIQYNISIHFNILFNTAVSRGYAKILEHILPHCRFLEACDKYFPRELVIRTGQEYKECVKLLLVQNFTIDTNSNRDKDFIYGAVENGHLEIVLQLLKLGIDVNLVNSNTRLNLLKTACINSHHKIIENLLDHNACLNETTPTNTELLKNFSYNYYNRHGYNHPLSSIHNKSDLCGLTCLHISVLNSDPMMTRLLLRYGAKIIDDPTFFNITCIAVKNNCEEIVRIFLEQGVDVNGIDHQGKLLLHFCVNTNGRRQDFLCNIAKLTFCFFSNCDEQDSRYNISKVLLERGAITHIQTPGNKVIFKAIANGHRKIAQLFLDYNADIQYISPDGDTLLHKAIENDFDIEFIKNMLKLNAPVNAVNKYLLTPLHIVCKLKSDSAANRLQLLLEHNANIEAVDARGWTPLFEACYSNNDIAVKCLLDHHANANHNDLDNLTPLYFAAQNCQYNSKVIKLLLEHKVNVHCMDKRGNSIIHIIVENGNAELVKSLARTQVNFNSVNKEGDTPLHIAFTNKSSNMVENLIKYGANVNILDKKNQTPLQNAMNYLLYCEKQLEKWRNYQPHYRLRRSTWTNTDDSGWDTKTYENNSHACTEVIKMLKVQVIKLKAAGLKVNNQNLNIVYNSNYYKHFIDFNDENMVYKITFFQLEVKCEQEIEKMKTENIGVNNMTFYDLLKKNIHFLSRYVKNKKIKKSLDLEVYDQKFPLYIDIVRSRFRDAKLRYRLMDSAKKYFSLNVCPRLPDDCIDIVFSYFNLKKIKMFIRAMKQLDG